MLFSDILNFFLMKSSLCYLACLLPFVIIANNPKEIVEGNNKFAFKLYHELKGGDKNLFYSPFSISTALAMTYAGAKNETALQMSQTMNFPEGATFHNDYRHLLDGLNKGTESKIKLNIANGLWAQKDFKFLDSYFDMVRFNYNSALNNVDFTNSIEREKTRIEINDWVEQKTYDKIKDLLAQGDLDSMTRLVLVNAIYFYGDWEHPFEKQATMPKDFIRSDGTTSNVPFMNQQGRYNYYEDEKIKAIEIPYKDNEASLVIFLPIKNNGMTEFGNSFDYTYYHEIIGSLKATEVSLSLPKFQTTFKLELGEILSRMGMPLAFDSFAADFSGMTGKRDLYISKVIHQAFIHVDEKGTEAAAATAVVMDFKSAPPSYRIKVFNADHPFVFLIKDNISGSILFMGKIMDPRVLQ
jgi:serpin B